MAKIKVTAKAQNRVALGIVHAYMVRFPHATIDDIRNDFPYDICPDCGVKELFVPLEVAEKFNAKGMSLYFAKEDEPLTMGNGEKVCLAQVWTKKSLQRAIEKAKHYEIEAEQSDYAERGSYQLEYLNGYVPPVSVKKKTSDVTIASLLATLILTSEESLDLSDFDVEDMWSEYKDETLGKIASWFGISKKTLCKNIDNTLVELKKLDKQEVTDFAVKQVQQIGNEIQINTILEAVIALGSYRLSAYAFHVIFAIYEALGIERDDATMMIFGIIQDNDDYAKGSKLPYHFPSSYFWFE